MNINLILRFVLVLLVAAFRTQASAQSNDSALQVGNQQTSIDFTTEIAPLLKRSCIPCHNTSVAEADINLETGALLAVNSGNLLVPGEPESSTLYLLAAHQEEPTMPPVDNEAGAPALTQPELKLLKQWIQSGASLVGNSHPQKSSKPRVLPPGLDTVFCSANEQTGRFRAIGTGNRVFVYSRSNSIPIVELRRKGMQGTRAAHDDFVQSVVISEAGQRIYTSGFRNVRCWEFDPLRQLPVPQLTGNGVAYALSSQGDYLAAITPEGEVLVGKTGTSEWIWKRQVPHLDQELDQVTAPILLAVSASGEAAVCVDQRVCILSKDISTDLELSEPVSTIAWTPRGELFAGDRSGQIHVITSSKGGKESNSKERWQVHKVSASSEAILTLVPNNPSGIIAIDSAATLLVCDSDGSIRTLGNIPTEFGTEDVDTGRFATALWDCSETGELLHYKLVENRLEHIPLTGHTLAQDERRAEWEQRKSEYLVAYANDRLSKLKEDFEKESEQVKKTNKELVAEQDQEKEQLKIVAKAISQAESSGNSVNQAKQDQELVEQQRTAKKQSIATRAATIDSLEKQLATLQEEQGDAKRELASLQTAEHLREAVERAVNELTDAKSNLAKQEATLAQIRSSLESKSTHHQRSEDRHSKLKQQILESEEHLSQLQTARDTYVAQSETLREQLKDARPLQKVLSEFSDEKSLIVQEPTGQFSLVTSGGDWLGKLALLAGHKWIDCNGSVLLMLDPDGKQVAFEFNESLWTLSYETNTESSFAGTVLTTDLHPHGDLLATGGGVPSRAGELKLWDALTGELTREFKTPHSDTIMCVRFSSDGRFLATGSTDRLLKVWDVESGELVQTLEGHTHHVTGVAWNPNQEELISSAADGSIKVWDLTVGKAVRTINASKGEITQIRYLGVDKRIAAVGSEGNVQIYRTDSGKREMTSALSADYLYTVSADREAKTLLVGGVSESVIVDRKGQILQRLERIHAAQQPHQATSVGN